MAATVVVGVLALPSTALAEPEPPERRCGPLSMAPIGEEVIAAAGSVELPIDPPELVPGGGPLDMDGDDQPDALTWAGPNALDIERADGTLSLTLLPPDPPYAGFPAPHGRTVASADVDGDGRDELLITRWYVAGFGQRPTYETYLVRGTTEPTTAELGDVASHHWLGGVVEDFDGDGLADIWRQGAVTSVSFGPADRWLSGIEVLEGEVPPDAEGVTMLDLAVRSAGFADLDLDGRTDHVVVGSRDGTTPPRVRFASGDEAPIPADGSSTAHASTRTTPLRSDVKQIVQFSFGPPQSFEVVGATCAEPWMRAATGWLLGRAPSSADYVGFGPLDAPSAPLRLARSVALVRSQTARGHQVDQAFAWFLGRPADPVGRAWWVSRLRSGARTQERMFAELLGSSERFRRSGSTAAGWVDDTYPLVLGRAPDPSGRAYWIRQVEQLGTGRTAARLLAETPARWFQADRHLGLADGFGDDVPAEVRGGARAFAAAGSLDAALAWAAARPEHYLRANQPPS